MKEIIRYTTKAKEFIEPQNYNIEYLTLGLVEEAGEVAGKVKRLQRGDYDRLPVEELILELGDAFYFFALYLEFLGVSLETVMERNLNKLNERKLNNSLKGSGDVR